MLTCHSFKHHGYYECVFDIKKYKTKINQKFVFLFINKTDLLEIFKFQN